MEDKIAYGLLKYLEEESVVGRRKKKLLEYTPNRNKIELKVKWDDREASEFISSMEWEGYKPKNGKWRGKSLSFAPHKNNLEIILEKEAFEIEDVPELYNLLENTLGFTEVYKKEELRISGGSIKEDLLAKLKVESGIDEYNEGPEDISDLLKCQKNERMNRTIYKISKELDKSPEEVISKLHKEYQEEIKDKKFSSEKIKSHLVSSLEEEGFEEIAAEVKEISVKRYKNRRSFKTKGECEFWIKDLIKKNPDKANRRGISSTLGISIYTYFDSIRDVLELKDMENKSPAVGEEKKELKNNMIEYVKKNSPRKVKVVQNEFNVDLRNYFKNSADLWKEAGREPPMRILDKNKKREKFWRHLKNHPNRIIGKVSREIGVDRETVTNRKERQILQKLRTKKHKVLRLIKEQPGKEIKYYRNRLNIPDSTIYSIIKRGKEESYLEKENGKINLNEEKAPEAYKEAINYSIEEFIKSKLRD